MILYTTCELSEEAVKKTVAFIVASKNKSECPLVMSDCDPMEYSPLGSSVLRILQTRILEWAAIPFSRGSSQPRIKPRSPTLLADSLPSEPPGDPKNPGVGSLFLLLWSSWPRNWTGVFCIAGRFFTSWATKVALYSSIKKYLGINLTIELKDLYTENYKLLMRDMFMY